MTNTVAVAFSFLVWGKAQSPRVKRRFSTIQNRNCRATTQNRMTSFSTQAVDGLFVPDRFLLGTFADGRAFCDRLIVNNANSIFDQ